MFFYEKKIVAEASSFIDGLKWIFGLNFMYGEKYTLSSSLTMEFLQRYIFDIQMNEMRGYKKTKSNQNKVVGLAGKLEKIKAVKQKFHNY